MKSPKINIIVSKRVNIFKIKKYYVTHYSYNSIIDIILKQAEHCLFF